MIPFRYDRDTAVVSTRQGPVRGYLFRDIHCFKGIPYAAARRFHAPEPPKPREEVLDASSFGYVCPLLSQDRPSGELFVPHRFWPQSEDCLNLNVWTPGPDGKKRPVLVWLHGGGYTAGSAIEHIAYEGENMARFGDCVAVSVNHRLNILGYLDLSAFGEEYENSGNAGGDDIIAALRWVRQNIAAFGGDPDNVTVFGQSGGGAKVTTLLQSPEADGLYARGYNMSGVIGPVLADETQSGEELVSALVKRLRLRSVRSLETVPYRRLADAYLALAPAFRAAGKYTGCRPHPNRHYLGDPCRVGFRKETAHIPMLVGSVFGEFSSFVPFAYPRGEGDAADEARLRALFGTDLGDLPRLFRAAYPDRPLIDLINLDTVFRLPEIDYLKKRSALNGCTWSYLFNQDMPVDGGRTPWHCADIPFVFRNTAFTPYTQMEGVTEKLEQAIFESVMAFARTGDPNNPAIPRWAPSRPDAEVTLVLDAQPRTAVNFDHALIPAAAAAQAALRARAAGPKKQNIQH